MFSDAKSQSPQLTGETQNYNIVKKVLFKKIIDLNSHCEKMYADMIFSFLSFNFKFAQGTNISWTDTQR